MIQLPEQPAPNERVLAGFRRERFTGLTTTALPLSQAPQTDTLMIWKNGTALDPNGGASGYAVSGAAVTLGTAAIAGDVFLCTYWPRTGGG